MAATDTPAPRGAKSAPPRMAGKASGQKSRLFRFLLSCAAVLLLCLLLPSILSGRDHVRVMSGLAFDIPEGFAQRYTDSHYAVWEYAGRDGRPGKLILHDDIRDGKGRKLCTVEEVLAECGWMTEAELYVNPKGVRMARGFADYSGSPERRYYIETEGPVLLMCMLEDERFYSRDDCEKALLQTAESVRPAK